MNMKCLGFLLAIGMLACGMFVPGDSGAQSAANPGLQQSVNPAQQQAVNPAQQQLVNRVQQQPINRVQQQAANPARQQAVNPIQQAGKVNPAQQQTINRVQQHPVNPAQQQAVNPAQQVERANPTAAARPAPRMNVPAGAPGSMNVPAGAGGSANVPGMGTGSNAVNRHQPQAHQAEVQKSAVTDESGIAIKNLTDQVQNLKQEMQQLREQTKGCQIAVPTEQAQQSLKQGVRYPNQEHHKSGVAPVPNQPRKPL